MTIEEYLLKIVIIGNNASKNMKIFYNNFNGKITEEKLNQFNTLGVDVSTHKIMIEDFIVKLIIVFTQSHDFFGNLRPNYYRNSSGAVIIFSKSNRKSFDDVTKWIKEFNRHIENGTISLLGIDNIEEIKTEEAKFLAQKLDMDYYEYSEDKKEIINKIFENLTKKILKRKGLIQF